MSKPAGECTGYLKDKSVILNKTQPLGVEQDKGGETKLIERHKQKLRLRLDHLRSVFLMLLVSSVVSLLIFFIEVLITKSQK